VPSLFKVEVCRVGEVLCIYRFMFQKTIRSGKGRAGDLFRPVWTADQKGYARKERALLRDKVHQKTTDN
jgi:hypothetical protein